jgi:hypothetical protein
MSWLRSLTRVSRSDPVAEIQSQVQWLTDSELASLMDALEVESVNRMANTAGYWDMETNKFVETEWDVHEKS